MRAAASGWRASHCKADAGAAPSRCHVRKRVAELSEHLADILHEVGVPYCKGGVMAKNPAWRGSLATRRARVGSWINRSLGRLGDLKTPAAASI